MVSLCALSDRKSPQVFRTLLSILADRNNAVVWMFLTHPHITKSSSPCINPLSVVPIASITIGITVTLQFNIFLIPWQNTFTYPAFCFLSNLLLCQLGQQNSQLFLLLIITISGRLAEIRWSVCISKSQTSLCVSFFCIYSWLFIIHGLSHFPLLMIFDWS